MGSKHHADCHRLAVGQGKVAFHFEGMSESVSIVEHRSTTRFALVLPDDVGFDLDATCDSRIQLERQQIVTSQEVVLRHLSAATTLLTCGQCVEHGGVAHHAGWLPESADQVLTGSKIDTSLATDGSVDHAHQCGGNVHHPNAAMPRCSGETRNVSDHSPAHTNNQVVAG